MKFIVLHEAGLRIAIDPYSIYKVEESHGGGTRVYYNFFERSGDVFVSEKFEDVLNDLKEIGELGI